MNQTNLSANSIDELLGHLLVSLVVLEFKAILCRVGINELSERERLAVFDNDSAERLVERKEVLHDLVDVVSLGLFS